MIGAAVCAAVLLLALGALLDIPRGSLRVLTASGIAALALGLTLELLSAACELACRYYRDSSPSSVWLAGLPAAFRLLGYVLCVPVGLYTWSLAYRRVCPKEVQPCRGCGSLLIARQKRCSRCGRFRAPWLKWTGEVFTAAILGLWLVSGVRTQYWNVGGWYFLLSSGAVSGNCPTWMSFDSRLEWNEWKIWRPAFSQTPFVTGFVLPLWIPLVLVVIPTALLIRRDWRRYGPDLCSKCGYNLTGNVSGVCPECGQAVTGGAVSDQVSR
jgi:hypothetical protein